MYEVLYSSWRVWMVFLILTLTDQASTIPSSKQRCCQSGTWSAESEQESFIEYQGTDPLTVRILYIEAVAKSWRKYKRPWTSPKFSLGAVDNERTDAMRASRPRLKRPSLEGAWTGILGEILFPLQLSTWGGFETIYGCWPVCWMWRAYWLG